MVDSLLECITYLWLGQTHNETEFCDFQMLNYMLLTELHIQCMYTSCDNYICQAWIFISSFILMGIHMNLQYIHQVTSFYFLQEI
jgi:hypothetical protein